MKKTINKAKLLSLALISSIGAYAQNFEITFNVTENPPSSGEYNITIPTHPGSSYTYNYEVDWNNDGTFETTGVTGDITHDFGSSGSKTIKIKGTFPAIFFKNSEDKEKLTAINNWGGSSFGWQTFASAFAGCSNLSSVPTTAPDLSSVDDMSFMFKKASSLNSDLNNWDVSGVDYMRGMFAEASSFNGNIASWSMSNVKDISLMFAGASAFNIDIGSWNTSAVTNMDGTFSNASSFNQELDWNTGAVTSMNSMFAGACAFNQVLDWDIADVNDMNHMLSGSGLIGCVYTRTLEAWESGTVQSGVTLGADGLQHSNPSARTTLTASAGSGGDEWTIKGDIAVSNDVCRDPSWFVTEWNISGGATITIPTNSTLTYNYDIDWDADGKFDDLGVTGDTSHTYSSGTTTQRINIRGDFPAIYFNNGGDKELITSIIQWGEIEWKSFSRAFNGCSNLEYGATDIPDLNSVNNFDFTFSNCSKFNGDIGSWNVTSVTTMASMFSGASSFNQDLGSWSLTSLTNASSMFRNAIHFNNGLDSGVAGTGLNSWDVDTVTTTAFMFNGATSFNQEISDWVVSNVTNMEHMFNGATNFNNGDNLSGNGIDDWVVSAVTKMNVMFQSATNFNRDIGSWNVASVTTMASMFSGASSFNQDLGSWSLTSLTNASSMFRNAIHFNNGLGSSIAGTGLNSWDVDTVTTTAFMFNGATSFNQEISDWVVSNVTNMEHMFNGATNFNNGDNLSGNGIDDWVVSAVTKMNVMFQSATNFNRDIGSWNVASVTTMASMFSGASSFNQDLGSWSLTSLTNASSMFRNAIHFNNGLGSSIAGTGLNSWDVDTVTTTAFMFNGATSFNQEISDWVVSNVTNMEHMFNGATNFNNGNNSSGNGIDDWVVSAVTKMNKMFLNASSFDRSIGNWNLTAVNNMTNMLDDCGMGYNSFGLTLDGWNRNSNTPTGITLGALNVEVCSTHVGFAARDTLERSTSATPPGKGWDIVGETNTCNTFIVGPTNSGKPAVNALNTPKLNLIPVTGSSTKQKKSSVGNTSSNQISVNTLSNGNLLVKQTKPSAVNNQLTLEVFNLNGQRVYQASQSTTNNNFNLSNLAKGAYVVKITTNNTVETQKISIP